MPRSRNTTNRNRWFQIGVFAGVSIAVLLIANSVSNYVHASQKIPTEILRRDAASRVMRLDQRIRTTGLTASANLNDLLAASLREGRGRLAWIQVRDSNGNVVGHAGADAAPTFSLHAVESKFREGQPVYAVKKTNAGDVLVEAFPIRLQTAAKTVAFRMVDFTASEATPATGVVEIASFLNLNGALAPLRRNLIINTSGGLALLAALLVLAYFFRAYSSGKKMEHQMEMARRVQQDLLPAPQALGQHFDLAADWQTAARVGGDFYDAFEIPGKGSALVFGDVSGKDISAAMLTGVVHGAVRTGSWSQSAAEHNEATGRLNRLLCENASRERFVTMFWSYFDERTDLLHYVNAGHCPPLLFRANKTSQSPLRLSEGGPVLGLLHGAQFEQNIERLEEGDVLVLYSDGIVEAADARGEEFGEQRLIAEIQRGLENDPNEIRDRILASVRAFTNQAQLEDDQTLLVVRYRGNAAASAMKPEAQAIAWAA